MKKYTHYGCLLLILLLLISGGGASWLIFHNRGLNRDFDPAIVAGSETRMWQAYYTQDKEKLGRELITLMREQFGLSMANAIKLTFVLGKATMTFGGAHGDYEKNVLPGLTDFYTQTKELSGGTWDPQAAAKAELAWWVARRTPGEDSPEHVGALIAQLYTVIYGSSNAYIEKAGLLRAQAADLRDQGGQQADWPQIESMLLDSYTNLHAGVIGTT